MFSDEQFERLIKFFGAMDEHFKKIASAMEKIAGNHEPHMESDFHVIGGGLYQIAEELQNFNEKNFAKTKIKNKKGK